METKLSITTERVDDFVLLIKMMMQWGLPAILDRHIPRHWLQEGLSWGWVATDKPTAKRLLQAFSNITLTIIQFPDQVVRHVTPLTSLQESILSLLGLSPDIYFSLAHNSTYLPPLRE